MNCFRPVAPIIAANDEKEAIRIANDSKFGLGASIWTQDLEKVETLLSLIQSGIVTVNNVVVSDTRVPFGGLKNSRFGRELSRYRYLNL
jgi:succinate-semialdehyde dehydrogenase/glutarate-semialdehyde dehydrogenase/succinyl-CoA reductase